jgi:CRISPR/Cas system-associated exonuclease Cas4 (RecB family)
MGYYQRAKPYEPGQKEAFKVSRSKIELFTQCPRCFWLDARLKLKRPNGPPFRINSAIDELLKKEFDVHRSEGTPHAIMEEFSVEAIPFAHKDLDKWRENFVGIQAMHEPSNLLVFGAVDDIWINADEELIVVDYKATAKDAEITINADWQIAYKRQLEVYQWLLRQQGFKVSDTGYFVYANGRLDVDGFYNKVEFRTKIIPYKGSDKWIEKTLVKMHEILEGDMPPVGTAAMGGPCDFCEYAKKRTELTIKHLQNNKK